MQVITVPLDDILWKFHSEHPESTVRCIKIDVEGAEILVFKGADTWLRSHQTPFVFAEVNQVGLAALGHDPDDMRIIMEDMGYKTYLLEDAEYLIQNDSVYNALFSTFSLEYGGRPNAEEDGASTQERSEEKGFAWQTS
jgi:hypothetical protein